MMSPQLGFVIQEIDVRRPARHEQINDPLGPGGEMRVAQDPRPARSIAEEIRIEQRRQRHRADAGRTAAEELAAGLEEVKLLQWVHLKFSLIPAILFDCGCVFLAIRQQSALEAKLSAANKTGIIGNERRSQT